jgi:hypothetical protein
MEIAAYLARPFHGRFESAAERRTTMARRNEPPGQAPTREHPGTFAELSVVSIRRPVDVGGRLLPTGAKGTVVAAYADGLGYEVEVFEPFHAVVTLEASDLAL